MASPVSQRYRITALIFLSLAATIALTASAEVAFAQLIGWPTEVAWCMAISLDAYVLAALSARREVFVAIVVSALANVGAHTVTAVPSLMTHTPGQDSRPVWWLIAAVSVVPPLILWRVHTLMHAVHTPHPTPDPASPAQEVPAADEDTLPALAIVTEGQVMDRMSVQEARQLIEAGWVERTPAAQVARATGRDRSYVARVYRQLDAAAA